MPTDDDNETEPETRDSDSRRKAAERRERVDANERREQRDENERRQRRDETELSGLSFSLPPIRLPDFFPAEFRVSLPIPGVAARRVNPRTVWAACIAFDVLDAVLALTVDAPLVGVVRAVGGTALAATVANLAGVVYAWEFAAVLLGHPELTVVPTLTLLLASRVLR